MTSRPALYSMVGITLLLTCNNNCKVRSIKNAQESLFEPQIRNVTGGPEDDVFYETSEGRAYVSIDGMPIDKYLDSINQQSSD